MSATTAPDRHVRKAPAPHATANARRAPRLGSYLASDSGQTREIVSLPRPDGSTFIVDYLARPLGDPRVVAHLAPDEPPENARIVSEMYLADDTRGRCRPLTPDDLQRTRLPVPAHLRVDDTASRPAPLRDAEGHLYRIRALATEDGSVPELRWTRSRDPGGEEDFDVLTLRDVVARLEDYEPARTITTDALALHGEQPCPSVHRLRAELDRLSDSATVLNRGLRELVERKIARGELTMSQIAMRCGRTRSDCRGNLAGETSWLARRLGQIPDSGQQAPTPWVHTDVLALIVRDGLGASPHEVELG